jgi:undecaprenyl-diphosphatase
MKRAPPRILLQRARAFPRWAWARERRWWLFLAASVAALSTFLEISEEVVEDDELTEFDQSILRYVALRRLPWLTITFVDITALGSLTLLALVTACAALPLWRIGDRRGAAQLATAVLGGGVWTVLTKRLFARERPELAHRLLEVHGYSFPSGHSAGAAALYVTLAFVLGRHLRTLTNRSMLLAASCFIAVLIGFSRVYLGVHYPSDVVSGLTFGSGWALLLTAAFEWHRVRGVRSTAS